VVFVNRCLKKEGFLMVTYADRPWLKHYEPQVPETVQFPDVPLQHNLEESARRYPDRAALIFKGRRISFNELNRLADGVAAALLASGFRKGDRAVIYMPNTPQFAMIFFGILKAGGVAVATNPMYTERELAHQLADCGAETVFVMSLFYEKLKQVQSQGLTSVRRIIVTNVKEYLPAHLRLLFTLLREEKEGHRVTLRDGDRAFQDFLADGLRRPRPNVPVSGDDMAILQYTGGTTGLSKGAIGLHRNIVANNHIARAWLTDCKEGQEVMLGVLPFFHAYGLVAVLNLSALIGATIILVINPRDKKDFFDSISKYKPTLFPGVPAMYVAITNDPDVAAGKYDVSSIRVCLSAAAPLLLETKERFEALTGCKLAEAYGLTEVHASSHVTPIYGRSKLGSVGLPLPGIMARVVDAEDGTREMPVNEPGEIVVKSPCNMPGYWNKPDETANTLRDGWLYTGDIGRMDEDGYFFIEDRKKDMIIAGGYKIFPRELEDVLMRHPAVMEVAVAGVPDPKRGETVKAWIVRKPGQSATADEIIEWSKSQLAAYKYPRLIEFRDELPKTNVGKVLKRELVKQEHAAAAQVRA
jgi:long-chain acyl-CoA synthetase